MLLLIRCVLAALKTVVLRLVNLPVEISDSVAAAAAYHNQMAALDFVLAAVWASDVDQKAVCRLVKDATRVTLVDWLYQDRAVRLDMGEGQGFLLLHCDKEGVYHVTDLTERSYGRSAIHSL